MCNFITGVLDAAADTAEFRALVEKHRLSFTPIENPSIAPQLRAHERYFHVTRSYCDCATNLVRTPKVPRLEGDVRKFRAKGWSQAKIERWLASKAPPPDRKGAGRDLLTHEDWMQFLDEALRLPSCPYVGLMMHTYKHSTDDEHFTIADRLPTTTQQLRDPEHRWGEDVLYEIRRAALQGVPADKTRPSTTS